LLEDAPIASAKAGREERERGSEREKTWVFQPDRFSREI
jgi:hypothetical protein